MNTDRFNEIFLAKTGGSLLPNPRRLHLGGTVKAEGWENFNLPHEPTADHVGDAKDLSRFSDGTFQAIYASHMLEHLDYALSAYGALCEWHRVLRLDGVLMISVPDLEVISKLMLKAQTFSDQFYLMRVLYGAHSDAADYHKSGWTSQLLATYLQSVGFSNVRRVENFGLFNDTSTIMFNGTPLSLNVLADKIG
jgi:predicted SAM-dependent methyltransferase